MHENTDTIALAWGLRSLRALPLLAASLLLGFTGTAVAQNDRAETAEFGVQLSSLSGSSYNGANGALLDVDNDNAIGIVGGYNFTNRFAVGAELTWADPAYNLTRVRENGNSVSISGDMDVGSFLLKGVFNFLEGDFTPFVEAGAGWIRVDSNVVSDSETGCWWDPWWGYVCTEWYETYSDTRTGYTYAVGFRWDASPDLALRASYGAITMDTDRALENVDLDAIRLEAVWKF
jgi:opacity protein-like surface antigen